MHYIVHIKLVFVSPHAQCPTLFTAITCFWAMSKHRFTIISSTYKISCAFTVTVTVSFPNFTCVWYWTAYCSVLKLAVTFRDGFYERKNISYCLFPYNCLRLLIILQCISNIIKKLQYVWHKKSYQMQFIFLNSQCLTLFTAIIVFFAMPKDR